MISIRTSERNGKVVTARLVKQLDEIMLISNKGVLSRTRVKEIRKMARATQGVKLMNLDEGTKLVGLEIVDVAEED
jgi:DNA gyrase subunit A